MWRFGIWVSFQQTTKTAVALVPPQELKSVHVFPRFSLIGRLVRQILPKKSGVPQVDSMQIHEYVLCIGPRAVAAASILPKGWDFWRDVKKNNTRLDQSLSTAIYERKKQIEALLLFSCINDFRFGRESYRDDSEMHVKIAVPPSRNEVVWESHTTWLCPAPAPVVVINVFLLIIQGPPNLFWGTVAAWVELFQENIIHMKSYSAAWWLKLVLYEILGIPCNSIFYCWTTCHTYKPSSQKKPPTIDWFMWKVCHFAPCWDSSPVEPGLSLIQSKLKRVVGDVSRHMNLGVPHAVNVGTLGWTITMQQVLVL